MITRRIKYTTSDYDPRSFYNASGFPNSVPFHLWRKELG